MAFHGTGIVLPKSVYTSDEGFDLRFSKRAVYGAGNYFGIKIENCFDYRFDYKNGLFGVI